MDLVNFTAKLLNNKLVGVLASLVLFAALITLIAWHLHIQWIFQLTSELVAMQYNTALCFLLLSLGLLCHGRLRWGAVISSGLALIIALLTLSQYFFHRQLGIDELFLTAQSFKETAYPGRMAPNTAVCFILLSLSLLSMQTNINHRLWVVMAFTFSVAVIAIGLLALAGYALNISIAYGWGDWTNMSPQTALLFVLLATGLIFTYLFEQSLDLNRREILLPVLAIGVGLIFCLLSWQALSQLNHEQIKLDLRNHGKLIASEMLNNLSWHQYSVNQLLAWQNSIQQNQLVPDTTHISQQLENMTTLMAITQYIVKTQDHVLEEPSSIDSSKDLVEKKQGWINHCLAEPYVDYISNTQKIGSIIAHEEHFLLCMLNKEHSKLVVMDLTKIFNQIAQRLLVDDTGLAVLKNGKSIYQTGEAVSLAFREQWQQILAFPMDECDCQLAIWPTQDYILSHSRWISESVIVFGLIITALFGVVLHYWLLSRKAHQSLQEVHLRSKKIFSENKLLYEQILDAGTDGWWDWQLDLNQEYLSPKLKRTLGYQAGDILDQLKGWQKILVPEDLRKIVENFKQHIQSKGKIPFYQEVRYRHKDGHLMWVIVRGQGIQDEDKKIRRMIGTHTDINRLKQTQANLSKSMMELNLVYQTTAYASKTTNGDQALQYCIDLICESIEWPIGHVYTVDQNQQRMVSRKIWYLNLDEDIEEFVDASETITYEIGVGLPGMVWEMKKPIWIEDIPDDEKCVRIKSVKKVGFKSAVGFPIIARNKVIAVLELFSLQREVTHPSYIRTFEVIGEQMGHVFERYEHEKYLTQMAHYDSITGIPNRRYFNEVLERRLAKSTRAHTKLAVLFIDLDNFKSINDSLGHDCGDKLLKAVSQILKNEIRESDFISRLSGDEFAVLIDPIEKNADAGFLANRIQHAIRTPIQIEQHNIIITLSIGIAVYPGVAQNANDLMKNADAAMYAAKKGGRNNYQYFTDALQKEYEYAFTLEQELHTALLHKEFSLVYQPIVNALDQCVVGIEALIRWDSPVLGYVESEKFINVAEDNGLIVDIGAWVFKQACSDFMQLREKYPHLQIKLAVNVSPLQLQYRHHLITFEKIIYEFRIDPADIIFEITENKLMKYIGESESHINELMQLGIQLAIDDFGVGHSSFKYLKILPFSILKIDKSFISQIDRNDTDKSITQGIIELTHSIKLKAVAEGVESKQQFEFLQNSQCDYIQGYFIAHPLSFAQLEQWLMDKK